MPHSWLIPFFEISGFIAFAIILTREFYHKNWRSVCEILCCAVFGIILEIGDSRLSNSYGYNKGFLVQIFQVPLTIGLSWAVIVYCSMLLSDQTKIPWYLRPFLDALTAVLIDVSLDTVAVRVGFWHWVIPGNQEWYGVPFDNLAGWIMVVLVVSFLFRFIRTLNFKRISTKLLMLFSPVIAYIGLFISIVCYSLLALFPYWVNKWPNIIIPGFKFDVVFYSPEVQLWKLILLVIMATALVQVVAYAIVKYRNRYLNHLDLPAFGLLAVLHFYSIILVFYTGIYKQEPYLAFLAIVVFLLYFLLHFLPYLLHPITVYIFKDVEKVFEKEEKVVEKVIEGSFK